MLFWGVSSWSNRTPSTAVLSTSGRAVVFLIAQYTPRCHPRRSTALARRGMSVFHRPLRPFSSPNCPTISSSTEPYRNVPEIPTAVFAFRSLVVPTFMRLRRVCPSAGGHFPSLPPVSTFQPAPGPQNGLQDPFSRVRGHTSLISYPSAPSSAHADDRPIFALCRRSCRFVHLSPGPPFFKPPPSGCRMPLTPIRLMPRLPMPDALRPYAFALTYHIGVGVLASSSL